MFKFLVKVFRRLCLLKFLLNLVDTLPDIRYCSKILYCTIPTPSLALRSRSQTEVKHQRFLVNVFRISHLLKLKLNLVDTLPDVRYWFNILARLY